MEQIRSKDASWSTGDAPQSKTRPTDYKVLKKRTRNTFVIQLRALLQALLQRQSNLDGSLAACCDGMRNLKPYLLSQDMGDLGI